MNVQLKHGWVLQKGQIPDGSHPVCNQFSSSLCPRTLAQVPFALQHHKKLPGWCQWPSSRNSKFCCMHNMKLFSFSGSYSQGKREGRHLAVLGSSISTTEHPEPLCLSGHSSFPSPRGHHCHSSGWKSRPPSSPHRTLPRSHLEPQIPK